MHELICTCYIHLDSFVFTCILFFLYFVFYYVTLLYLKCSIVLRVRIKDDDITARHFCSQDSCQLSVENGCHQFVATDADKTICEAYFLLLSGMFPCHCLHRIHARASDRTGIVFVTECELITVMLILYLQCET